MEEITARRKICSLSSDKRVLLLIAMMIPELLLYVLDLIFARNLTDILRYALDLAFGIWLFVCIVRFRKGFHMPGIRGIRRFMCTQYVLACILAVILAGSAIFIFVGGSLSMDVSDPVQSFAAYVFPVLLIALAICICAFYRSLNHVTRCANRLVGSCSIEEEQMPGKTAEIFLLIGMTLSVVLLILECSPALLEWLINKIPQMKGTILPSKLTVADFIAILTTVFYFIKTFTAYTLLRDVRKAIGECRPAAESERESGDPNAV